MILFYPSSAMCKLVIHIYLSIISREKYKQKLIIHIVNSAIGVLPCIFFTMLFKFMYYTFNINVYLGVCLSCRSLRSRSDGAENKCGLVTFIFWKRSPNSIRLVVRIASSLFPLNHSAGFQIIVSVFGVIAGENQRERGPPRCKYSVVK